jgi:ferredoxin-type protein NapH
MTKQAPLRQRIRTSLLLISWLLFPLTIYYFSPYLIVAGAAMGIVNGSLIVFTLMLLAAIVFGRSWCGWLCPAATLQEAAQSVNPAQVPRWMGRIKWVIWSLWIGLIAILVLRAGGYNQINPFYQLDGGLSINSPGWYIIFLAVNGLALGLAVFAGRRGFCHSVCWMAPFMIIGRRIGNLLRVPGLRLNTEPTSCTGCQLCTRRCPMSIDVMQQVRTGSIEDSDCILCGNCVDGCRSQAIHFSFTPPAPQSRPLTTEVEGTVRH